MKTKRVLYPLLLFILALILTVTPAGTAMGWGNGEGNLSSYGAHDWIVSQAYELAGGSAGAPWLILSTALASCDDPDYMSNKVDAYHNYHPLVSPPDTMPTPYPHGGAHDQVRIGYDQILAAIAAGQRSAASKAFGILAHYYADVCQPMHTDEALSEGWTHSRYEMAVDRYTRSASYNRSWVIPDGLQPVLGSEAASAKTVEAATAAHPYYRTLVSTYAGSGMNTTVLNITKASLNNAANGLADILAGLSLRVPGANVAPVARAGATPTSGKPPLTVDFDGTGSNDPDGNIVSYLWDFGDGSTSTEPNPSHTYTTTGTRTAKLTVTDDNGATGTATVTIKALPVMRVQSISMSISGFWYYRTVRGSVLVTDTNGTPISNATVKATWSGTTTGAASATTGSNGIATFSKSLWASSGQVTLAVTDVTKTGCVYDAGLNLETQDGISF